MHTRHAFALLALAPTLAFAQSAAQQLEPASTEQLMADAAAFTRHVNVFASPFFEGRAPGTRGNRLAADYLEFNLRAASLQPAFGDTGYRQPFTSANSRPPHGQVKIDTQRLTYDGNDLVPGRDFNVLGYSADGEVSGTLAFAGYSISEGKDGYNTYADEPDLSGKVVMVLRFEPMNDAGRSRWAAATDDDADARRARWSAGAQVDGKLRAAADAGAAAIIFVNPPGVDDDRAAGLEGLNYGRPLKIPVVMMSIDAADKLVRAADPKGRSLLDLRERADTKGEVIGLGDTEVSIAVARTQPSLATDNVGAVIAGSGALADQWVVIGAHYDHVGYGPVGARPDNFGKIHPGADDNASGSCGNLIIAERFARELAGADAPRRSILFLWFSAEESGLDGAQHFVRHPTMPLNSISLMLNMDMIGRLRDGKLEVGGVATGAGLEEWTAPYWAASGLTIKPTRIGAPNSDHFAFHIRKVPNIFAFTGLHPEYHTPADTLDTLNIDGAVQVADLVARIALDAAHREEPFPFSTGQIGADEESDKPADKPADKADPHAGVADTGELRGLKVKFGIMPGDYSADEGVLIGGLSDDNLPAGKAGLREGDLMLTWDGVELKGVVQWMEVMSKNKPGDKVVITYRRGDQTHTTTANLVAPSKPRQ